ncbi:MAG: DUF4149 domain-containing protein [Tepidisphaeraceae bacterium]
MLLQLFQTAYWAALATWFGSAMFVALAIPIIFRVVRDADPTLPRVLYVNLDGQHSTLLAGEIVSGLLRALHRIGVAAAAVILVTFVTIVLLAPPAGTARVEAMLRAVLLIGAIVANVYDWRVLGPRLASNRRKFIDNADNPDVANPALEQYDHDQREAAFLLYLQVALLLGTILFSVDLANTVKQFSPG